MKNGRLCEEKQGVPGTTDGRVCEELKLYEG